MREPDMEMVERARAVAVKVADRAAAAERARELPPETVGDLHGSGLLAMANSLAQGGTDADLITQLAVLEIIGGACASTAWCLANHLATQAVVGGLLGEGFGPYIKAVVEEGAVFAAAHMPAGTGKAAPGGFVCSGRWPFVSFSNRARWAFLSTPVDGPPPGWAPSEETPDPPQSHIRLMGVEFGTPGVRIEDTWKAMALRASMSNDVVLDEVFIPEELAPPHNIPRIDDPWPPSAKTDPNVRKSIHPLILHLVHIPAVMLGIAEAALRDTIEYGKARSMSIGGQIRGSMPGNQFAVADAAMAIESGRAYIYRETRVIMERVEAGEACSPSELMQLRMADLLARENAQKAVDRLFSIRGAHGLYESARFERYYRDVRIGTLPAWVAPDLVREEAGKHLFGIPADVKPRWG